MDAQTLAYSGGLVKILLLNVSAIILNYFADTLAPDGLITIVLTGVVKIAGATTAVGASVLMWQKVLNQKKEK
jgi:hypothetical protein